MRHRQRHVHATIVKHVTANLDYDGWITAPVNFGTTPVTVMDYEPQQAGETPPFNAVSVSMGDQGADNEAELGGLRSCRYTVFIDVYGINEPIGVAISEDIKGYLTDEIIPVRDFTSDVDGTVTTEEIEFETVVVETIPSAASTLDKRSWRAVKATAVVYF